ncbi:hypothetical protein [uncultured Gammaproteobacteria bacterium]|nr:hypothetical protein [uncultured Gammaproteobacteria bacterium]CAC9995410.1 hypothetical protein [uncultured Gammaproteobacteria bacterium]
MPLVLGVAGCVNRCSISLREQSLSNLCLPLTCLSLVTNLSVNSKPLSVVNSTHKRTTPN